MKLVVGFTLLLAALFHSGLPLKCYVCDSAVDPACVKDPARFIPSPGMVVECPPGTIFCVQANKELQCDFGANMTRTARKCGEGSDPPVIHLDLKECVRDRSRRYGIGYSPLQSMMGCPTELCNGPKCPNPEFDFCKTG